MVTATLAASEVTRSGIEYHWGGVSGRLLDLVKAAPLGLAGGVASGADEGRHDELASLAQDVARGDRVATRTLLATLVPSLLRVVRKVLGQAHPEVEDVT